MKHCNFCNRDLPEEDFIKRSNTPSGIGNRCKACARQFYYDNREKQLENHKKYHEEHKEARNAYVAEHYINGYKERKMELQRRRRIEDPEKNREMQRKWEKNNPAKRKMYKAIRRAREGVRSEPIDYDLIYERDNGICYLCGEPLTREEMHGDHVVSLKNGGTHTMDNIRATHGSCNQRKGAKWLHELSWYIGNSQEATLMHRY